MEHQRSLVLSSFANALPTKMEESATEQQQNTAEHPSKIFINPKFAKAHINPMFLTKNGALRTPEIKQENLPQASQHSQIHFNPAFLGKLQIQQVSGATAGRTVHIVGPSERAVSPQEPKPPISVPDVLPARPKWPLKQTVNPIIKNTRRKLVRASAASDTKVEMGPKSIGNAIFIPTISQTAPLVRIGKNKLIRSNAAGLVLGIKAKPNTSGVLPERKSLRIDRRQPLSRISIHKPTFVKRYALSRIDGISPKKVVITDPKLLKLKRNSTTRMQPKDSKGTIAYASKNKQLVLVNINGVLYRSSTNKLQKSVPRSVTETIHPSPSKPARKIKDRYLIIRGVRFALDRTGMKLRSIGADTATIPSTKGLTEPRLLNRIDIGGLTYKARKDGTFIRTDNHKTRNHLSTAKQRSIQLLTSRLKKCNEPCHIYRRLGKCLAQQRGKCPKLHDPKHVSICQKFLRGECLLDGCLLSHDVTLEKMPVCRFFLEGRCMHDPCPYLHKKVSEKERICNAFLNGFCPLADKCPNRHVFQCPEFERNGKCDRIKCPYPHGRKEPKRKHAASSTPVIQSNNPSPKRPEPSETSSLPMRYYRNDEQSTANLDEKGELSASERNQLQRMLGEVDKMHSRLNESGNHSPNVDGADSRPKAGEEETKNVSIPDELVDGDSSSEACGIQGEPTPDVASSAKTEEDSKPPVLRRKALGDLPAFIPI